MGYLFFPVIFVMNAMVELFTLGCCCIKKTEIGLHHKTFEGSRALSDTLKFLSGCDLHLEDTCGLQVLIYRDGPKAVQVLTSDAWTPSTVGSLLKKHRREHQFDDSEKVFLNRLDSSIVVPNMKQILNLDDTVDGIVGCCF